MNNKLKNFWNYIFLFVSLNLTESFCLFKKTNMNFQDCFRILLFVLNTSFNEWASRQSNTLVSMINVCLLDFKKCFFF